MRLAFASCMNTRVFREQPVWDWIAAEAPDHLLLLGDSVYLDVPLDGAHPQAMSDDAFARHLYQRWSGLLQQPAFARLVRSLPPGRVWAIWDDHDFLWNDVPGAEFRDHPVHAGQVRLSTAFFRAVRRALAAGLAPGSWPAAYDDPVFWSGPGGDLEHPSIALAPDVWLHLTDGRTHRTGTWLVTQARRTVFGAAQRQALAAAYAQAPQDAVHLLACGSVMGSIRRRYADDWQWLLDLAAQRRTLVLSGDLHRNDCDAFHTGGWPLHEATSSGAAVRDAVVIGRRQQNFGLLEINALHLRTRYFARSKPETVPARTLSRAIWVPV